jgi:hypothetical protein
MKRRDDPAELSLVERGRTLAALRLLGPIAAAARLRSPAARRHLERLCEPAERAAEERALGATVPAGLAQIDPSWYDAPPRTRSLAAQRYLERIAFGRLVPMTAASPATPASMTSGEPDPPERGRVAQRAQAAVDALLLGPLERLEGVLLQLGRRRVAIAFTGAPRSALAQLLARLGEPEASRLVAELRAIPPGVSAEEVKAAQRALFRSEPEPAAGESAALFLRRVGCGWIAPLVERGQSDRARRLAQRLPRRLGEVILRESTPAATTASPGTGPGAPTEGGAGEAERAGLLRLMGSLLPTA